MQLKIHTFFDTAHIIDMGSVFFLLIFFLLFLPIYIEVNLHFDMNRRKLSFGIYGYKFIKLLGGYIATYSGGLALHVSDKKAIIVPYIELNNERKRFSFFKFFRLKKVNLSIETGAEYLLYAIGAHIAMRAYYLTKTQCANNIKNNLMLVYGDSLKVSFQSLLYFNLFMLIGYTIKFIKEKIQSIWQKNIKKSTI